MEYWSYGLLVLAILMSFIVLPTLAIGLSNNKSNKTKELLSATTQVKMKALDTEAEEEGRRSLISKKIPETVLETQKQFEKDGLICLRHFGTFVIKDDKLMERMIGSRSIYYSNVTGADVFKAIQGYLSYRLVARELEKASQTGMSDLKNLINN